MRTQKIFVLAILTIAFALGAAVMPAMAAETGESGGTFSPGNTAPDVTVAELFDGVTGTGITQMDPTVEVAFQIDVTDINTIEDLNTIVVVVKRTAYTEGDAAAEQATYTWTSSGTTGTWALAGSTTWAVDAATSGTNQPSDWEANSGTWWLVFTPGKIAKEDAAWTITATATDKAAADDALADSCSMDWYGELNGVETSVGFGTGLSLGATHALSTGDPADDDVDLTAISNGAYKLRSKTSATWTSGTTSDTVAVVQAAPSAHEIMLIDHLDTQGSATAVTTADYGDIVGYGSETSPTAEGGDAKAVHVWLTLPSSGLLVEQYSGTYYLQIANN